MFAMPYIIARAVATGLDCTWRDLTVHAFTAKKNISSLISFLGSLDFRSESLFCRLVLFIFKYSNCLLYNNRKLRLDDNVNFYACIASFISTLNSQ